MGIQADPDKIRAITEWAPPTTTRREEEVPDALSGRDQDNLKEIEIVENRTAQRISGNALKNWINSTSLRSIVVTLPQSRVFDDSELHALWDDTLAKDETYQKVFRVIKDNQRSLPSELKIKLQISECNIDSLNRLLFRGRIWIPGGAGDEKNAPLDALRTKLIQITHDSAKVGQPGRDRTIAILSRYYYWPMMHQHVRQFLRNCDKCGRTRVWREHKKGFLKPMPIPDRYYSETSMDFIAKLPPSETPFGREQKTNILVVTDRLFKDVTLEALPTTDAEAVAKRFMWSYYRFHGFPRSVTSGQDPQWIGRFWKHLCKLAGVEQRLTSACDPQTDGGTER
ncbi:hypothetical protein K3495_g2268 [Podosphaera aphanis]|nr:hypothetical protein K3495_g2268 [Podosphaera aphanis]